MATAAWLSAALPYVGGGVLGAAVTYGLTWLRERRRTHDPYRAPQRHAIGDIITATHALMIRELEMRTALTELVEQIRRQEHFDVPAEQRMATSAAMGSAVLDIERAFQIGSLTIVDAPCWEAMGAAYLALTRLRAAMTGAPKMQSPDEVKYYVAVIERLAKQLNQDVTALVLVANQRESPTENTWNRRRRASPVRRALARAA